MNLKLVVGIDLAGNPKNRSGFAIIREEFGQKETTSKTLFTDEEILQEIKGLKPNLVAIDAPLTSKNKNRECDNKMKQYGGVSLSLPGVQMLAKRAFSLSKGIAKLGIPIIEVCSRATSQIIGLDRQSLSKSVHEADAILAAITGFLYLEEKTKEIGDKEGKIVIPKPSRKKLLSSSSP